MNYMGKWILALLLLLVATYLIYSQNLVEKLYEWVTLKHMVSLSSPAFSDMSPIPAVYTCDGRAINPPLSISDVEGTAQSLVLTVEDPDAPGKTFDHWVVFNIPPNTLSIAENSVPAGSTQGASSTGTSEYVAPCPPTGSHRYVFTLYVLDNVLSLPEGATKQDVLKALAGHVMDKAQLTGIYTKQ